MKNPDLGRTYQRIADEGVELFYSGVIADQIEADMQANGGLLSKQDLAACALLKPPLTGTYRGFDIATNQLPGGGLMVLEMLNILENFDLASMGHNTAAFIATVPKR